MSYTSTFELLAVAGVRQKALEEALQACGPDHATGTPSLHSLSDRANERLRSALNDYIVSSSEIRYWATEMAKQSKAT